MKKKTIIFSTVAGLLVLAAALFYFIREERNRTEACMENLYECFYLSSLAADNIKDVWNDADSGMLFIDEEHLKMNYFDGTKVTTDEAINVVVETYKNRELYNMAKSFFKDGDSQLHGCGVDVDSLFAITSKMLHLSQEPEGTSLSYEITVEGLKESFKSKWEECLARRSYLHLDKGKLEQEALKFTNILYKAKKGE